MESFLLNFLMSFLIIAVLIVVHELGHYLAGRTAGIPSERMRIVLTSYPPRVVLWNERKRQWEEGGFEEEVEAYRIYDPSCRYLFRVTAGGIIFETIFTVTVAMLALGFGQQWFATKVVSLSLLLNLLYLLMDVVWAPYIGKPWGDITSLWSLSAVKTLVFLFVVFGVRIALLLMLDWDWYGIFDA